jgi:hypothetical protein
MYSNVLYWRCALLFFLLSFYSVFSFMFLKSCDWFLNFTTEPWKHVETHQSMVSSSTHLLLVVHQLRTREEWLGTWQTNVPLLPALTAIQVSWRTSTKCYAFWFHFLIVFLIGFYEFQIWAAPFLVRSCVNKLRKD